MQIGEPSFNAKKVHRDMKQHGFVGEDNMVSAERITQVLRMPKNQVMNALQELQQKGYVKRKVREKAAGYFVVENT